jgi:hypothetical protein
MFTSILLSSQFNVYNIFSNIFLLSSQFHHICNDIVRENINDVKKDIIFFL